jgi:hypothetical protein
MVKKELHIVPLLEEYAECIVYLGECDQPGTPLSCAVLYLIKSKPSIKSCIASSCRSSRR